MLYMELEDSSTEHEISFVLKEMAKKIHESPWPPKIHTAVSLRSKMDSEGRL